MEIKENSVLREIIKIEIERELFGRPLLVGSGQSQRFWKRVRHNHGDRWWKFWQRTDEIEAIVSTIGDAAIARINMRLRDAGLERLQLQPNNIKEVDDI